MACGCKSVRCVCDLVSGAGTNVSGNGSARNPYIVGTVARTLQGTVESGAEVTVTGTGVTGDPWIVSVDTIGGSVTQTIYENSDTWTKPEVGTIVHVVVIGGGGGGGRSTNQVDVDNAGGSGGNGGAMSIGWFAMADLPDTVALTVGTGGAGANSSGTGVRGENSFFGDYLLARGGDPGKSQGQIQSSPTIGGTWPEGGPGGSGSYRSGSTVQAEEHRTYVSPTGGGLGAGDVAAATNGGTISVGRFWAGEGGDGGAPGADGQAGEDYGGGGGGGGTTFSGGAIIRGKGGAGANGVVVVTVW